MVSRGRRGANELAFVLAQPPLKHITGSDSLGLHDMFLAWKVNRGLTSDQIS